MQRVIITAVTLYKLVIQISWIRNQVNCCFEDTARNTISHIEKYSMYDATCKYVKKSR